MKKFRIFQISLYAIFFVSVYTLGLFIGRTLELTLILMSYFTLRYTFAKTWHSRRTMKCIVSSILAFWVAEVFSLPVEVSILCSIIFGYLISYGLYLLQDYLDLKFPPSNFYELDEGKLEGLVKKYNLTEVAYNRLKMRYIEKMTCQQIATLECVELKTIEEYFRLLKKRLK